MRDCCNWIHVDLGSCDKTAAPNTEEPVEELGRGFEKIITGINKLDANGMGLAAKSMREVVSKYVLSTERKIREAARHIDVGHCLDAIMNAMSDTLCIQVNLVYNPPIHTIYAHGVTRQLGGQKGHYSETIIETYPNIFRLDEFTDTDYLLYHERYSSHGEARRFPLYLFLGKDEWERLARQYFIKRERTRLERFRDGKFSPKKGDIDVEAALRRETGWTG